ncbi:MAG: hypothetical protein HGA83_07380 [Bacteroidales bacterium]|nr:hypothetical protein [Bacteroidales bacterium]
MWLAELKTYQMHAEQQIDQIRRRVFQGKKIPHAEKVFSLFQPRTEWISKGKAGGPWSWVYGWQSSYINTFLSCIVTSWKGVHGLDKCPDHGIAGLKCYAALAVVARNLTSGR